MMGRCAILIAGPSASGKSRLALRLARNLNGVVINADSLQVYNALPILTAQPSADDKALIRHDLYGDLDITTPHSAGDWLTRCQTTLTRTDADGMIPIIVGGSGFYFTALECGLSPMPAIDAQRRREIHAQYLHFTTAELHDRLALCDPALAATMTAETSSRRFLRALEVYEATGRPLSIWHRMPPTFTLGTHYEQIIKLLLMPPRADLYAASSDRFDSMVAAGAREEIIALISRIDRIKNPLEISEMPILKALGFSQLRAWIEGQCQQDTAKAEAKMVTRHYIKRQITWFRHHMPHWTWFDSFAATSMRVIDQHLDHLLRIRRGV